MKPLSVYIHIPFCERRCNYCDFVSCTDVQNIDQYLEKVCHEIGNFNFENYQVKTIYIGGGTPSLLEPKQLEFLFSKLPACDGEVTIEVNPNS
ncbi:MAG: radical SAM protein, partial [Clostridia bacterium]|nr:radical SAM protein [Clostridia bacterium]